MFTLIAIVLTVIGLTMLLHGSWNAVNMYTRIGFFTLCAALGFWILVFTLISFDLIPWLIRVLP